MKKALIVGLLACTMATAATASNRVDNRQNRQAARINQGTTSGSLTHKEAARLQRQQNHVAHYEARSRADGNGLSRRERARLNHMQNRSSANIRHQKHDGQHAH